MIEEQVALDATIELPDGRRLGYAEYGAPQGEPLFAFHGTPGARTMLSVIDAEARRLGIRIIAPDRPGFGLSDFKSRRGLLDWPDDVSVLADRLGLERFAVAGVSGGGPYALACACRIPRRLTTVGVVSTMGPVVESGLNAALTHTPMDALMLLQHAPLMMRAVAASVAFGVRHFPERIFDSLLAASDENDRRILQRPAVKDCLLEAFGEAFRHGAHGTSHELKLFGRAWGFDLREITTVVHLWHGEADVHVPVIMGHYVAGHLPRCHASFIPEAGHYWIFDHQTDLLRALFPH